MNIRYICAWHFCVNSPALPVSLFGFCCVRAHVELRFECECKWTMVLIFRVIHIMYNSLWCNVLKYPIQQDEGDNYCSILMQLCQKTVYLWPSMHTWWESIWCRKKSMSCHVMYNTEIIKILTLRVQIALSLRQDLSIIVSLASIGKPNTILYNTIFVLCMQ